MTSLGRIIVGDAATELAKLPADSVDCVVTSPPYFLLRDYGVGGQIGLERRVEDWVGRLVAVLDEIARVLKPTGSVWLNVGDSFSRRRIHGAPPKGLVLAPERLLLRLTERGWICRNKVVWAKVNYMPASVRDRLAVAWEPLYLLVRSPHYFFDLDAIRVPHRTHPRPRHVRVPKSRPPWGGPLAGSQSGLPALRAKGLAGHPLGKNPGDVWHLPTSNLRSAHHSAFPEALVERPLLATCPERTCRSCGQPWVRETVRRDVVAKAPGDLSPTCRCASDWQPGLALDPFLGAATTAVVAERLGRRWIGIELNPEFAVLGEQRLAACRSPDAKAA